MPDFAFQWNGNHPALDFVNTLVERPSAAPREHLVSYAALVAFVRQAGLIDARTATALTAQAAGAAAARVLANVREFREAFHRILGADLAGKAPARGDLEALNACVAETHAHRLLTDLRGIVWNWDEPRSVRCPLWELTLSVEALLFHPRRDKVRKCAAEECGALFIDLSKTGRRRWCSMANCGNRHKVHRFRARREG